MSNEKTSTVLVIVCPNCGKLANDEDIECSWCKFSLSEDEQPKLSEIDESLRKSARDAHFKLVEGNPYKMLKAYEYLEIAQAVKAHISNESKFESFDSTVEHIEENYVYVDERGNARLNKLGCALFLARIMPTSKPSWKKGYRITKSEGSDGH